MKIEYIKSDLFTAPNTQLLVHACNCQGVWGSGVALQFKARFYTEFQAYKHLSGAFDFSDLSSGLEHGLLGKSLIINKVGCLFTSLDYGKNVDSPEKIISATKTALEDLLNKTTMDIAMPKINSGLFRVPWEDTERVILDLPDERTCYVYTLE